MTQTTTAGTNQAAAETATAGASSLRGGAHGIGGGGVIPGAIPQLSARAANPVLGAGFTVSRVPLAAGGIALTGGVPDPALLPIAELADAFTAVLGRPDAGTRTIQYHGPFGVHGLRSWIAQDQGTDLERVVVTNGALHSVSYAVEALIEPGDLVVVENPTFPLALQLFRYYRARVESVPLDSAGLDVDALERLLKAGARPKLLYTIPDFHNPATVTLPAERRSRLVELAERHGFVIVSDNPYGKLRFSGEPAPDFDLDSEHVVRAGTFSKVLGPGLRLGWAIAPSWLRDTFVRTRFAQDQHAGLVTQRAVEHLAQTDGLVERVVAGAVPVYAERAAVLFDALRQRLGDRFEARRPDGGLFLWARVPGADLTRVLDLARARGLAFSPGDGFDPDGRSVHREWARFSYSSASPEQLVIAADRFAQAVAEADR